MRNKKKISQRFYLISFLLFAFVTAIFSAFVVYDRAMMKERIEDNLLFENQRLMGRFNDSLSYTKHLMGYIGGQIKQNNAAKNYNFINQLLVSYRIPSNEIMVWSTFSWADEHFHLVVSSNHGIDLQNYGNLSRRDYMPRTVTNPETLQSGAPVFGIKSNLWSIPIGYGITDQKGKYLGSIVTGIVIDGLKERMSEIITNNKISFVLIDVRNMEIIAQSDALSDGAAKNIVKNIDRQLTEKMVFGQYFYYKKMADYPYVIVTVYAPETDFYNRLAIYFALIVVTIVLVGLPLILFERKLIAPIKKLSKIAADISSDKEPTFFCSTNILEIAHLETQLKNIQQYKVDLLRAKDAQANFFLNMSHELRTPLTGVISFAELMKKEIYGPLLPEYLTISNQIYSSGKHLLLLIDNLLNFSKIKSGKMKLSYEDLVIAEEITEAINKIRPEIDRKNLRVELNRDEKITTIRADRWMFQSIMLNLLSNAIKFSYMGGDIKVNVRFDRGGNLEIEVHDFGLGIREEDLLLVLEEYGQAQDGYKTHHQKGTGLGLPLTRKLTEMHKGRIDIKSIYKKETRVILTFPGNMVKN